MFVTSQPLILDVDYQDPNQVEILRQQLTYQYENYCYGSKKISSNTKKQSKQIQHSNIHGKQGFNQDQNSQKRIIGKEIQNSMQNDTLNEAINNQMVQSKNKNDQANHYQIEIKKNSSTKKKRSPSPTLNQSQAIPINISQKQYENSVYLSPLLQNCIEEDITSQEQQRSSSVPSKKYFEMIDYSKDKLQKIYGITGNFEMSRLYERKESPRRNLNQNSYQVSTAEKNNQNQLSQLYDVEIKQTDKKDADKNASFLISSNVTSINQASHEKLNSQHQSLTAPPKTQNNTQRNSTSIQIEKPIVNSQKNSQEDLQEIKKKIDQTEQYDIGKGRNSVQVMKPNNISSYSSNTYWSVSQKRNSTGFISQVQTIKNSNEDNFQFTNDERHTHQLIKNSGIYLRNKPEYLSDPRYKLIENLNKISQTVNIQNINNHSVRQDKKKKQDMSRVIPYFHNFIDSYKESFYHPQTSFENKYKIYNPRKSQEFQKLPHNNYSKLSYTTPRNTNKQDLNQKDGANPLVTPFCETSYVEEDLCKIKYAKKLNQISQETQEEDQGDDEQFYQGSKNRYNCLYLNRNLRVRISRNQSPNRKKNNIVNQSADSSLNSKKNSIQFEDPRKEYRDKQKRLEQMLNVASNNKQNEQQQEINNTSDRYTPSQDSVYLKKSRNYSTPYRNSYLPQNYQPNQTNDYTLNAFVFKNTSNTSQK